MAAHDTATAKPITKQQTNKKNKPDPLREPTLNKVEIELAMED
jgi:hypothetical protein